MQGRALAVFPADLCRLHELKLIDNFWEAHDLTKIDLSNNEIESIPEDIVNQEVSSFPSVSLTCMPRRALDDFEHQLEHQQADLDTKRSLRSATIEVPGHLP